MDLLILPLVMSLNITLNMALNQCVTTSTLRFCLNLLKKVQKSRRSDVSRLFDRFRKKWTLFFTKPKLTLSVK
jgi:hypothetical protein